MFLSANRLIVRTMVNFMISAGYTTEQFNTFVELLMVKGDLRANRLYIPSEINLAFQLAIEI